MISDRRDTFICADCAGERGYFWPKEGSVYSRRVRCDYCEKKEICFDVDDLLPILEGGEGEHGTLFEGGTTADSSRARVKPPGQSGSGD